MRNLGLLVSSVILLLASNGCKKSNIMNIRERTTNEVILSVYLGEMSEKLGCYFTLEHLKADNHGSLINSRNVFGISEAPNVTNVNSLIAKLRHDLPGCLVMESKNNPNILHIIEAPLAKLKDYAMERHEDLTYSGDLGTGKGQGLILEIAKNVENIGPRTGGDLRTAFDDHITKVNVKAKNEKLRDILTDCVPLASYGSFLWIAETTKVGETSKTVVQYFGPKRVQ